jgi:hypothetical protein
MYDFVDTICKKFGPRYSCSNAEKEANLWIREELDKFCDSTFIDEFEIRPGLYPQGLIKFTGFFAGISFLFIPLKFPLPILSTFFVLLGLFILYTELFLMKEWIRPFFKKLSSSNVFGIIKPLDKVKFRIIFEGHTDSAKQMNIASYKLKKRQIIVLFGLSYLFFTITISILKFIAQIIFGISIIQIDWWIFSWTIVDYIYFIPLIIIYPFFIWLLKGFLGKTVVFGANDNLSASAVTAAIGKYLSQNRPRNLEVWIGSQGSEEVGDKGANAFIEKYSELGILDNSYSIVLECCGAADEILLIEKDMHKAEYNDEINEIIVKAYEKVKEENHDIIPLRTKGRLIIGACDACRYIHKGYKASAYMGVEKAKNMAVNWHSIEDSPENLNKKVLMNFLELSLKIVEIVDNKFD